MSNKIVSFIIPAYNAADTIVRCLESIRNLTLKKEDYEIIVIDDCSTDNTVALIDDWRSKIENLTLLRQTENHRQGAARNRCVKVAKGQFICFVDADDEVKSGIEKAIRLATEKKTDMTAYHYAFVNQKRGTIKEADKLSFEEGQLFSGIEMQNRHPYWCSGPVAYVYNKAFLERVDYPFAEGVLFEDSDYVAVHLYHAKRMTYSNELGYLAYEREGSTTRHTSYINVADYLLLGVRMLKFYECLVNSREPRVEQFAEVILEGACFNVAKACNRLMRLQGIEEVRAFYQRVDGVIERSELYIDKNIKRYYWNTWTMICLRHKNVAMLLLALCIPMFKLIKK